MELSLTLGIVIITCIISIPAFSNQKMLDDLIFYGPGIQDRKQYYRFITHGFIHADIPHLAFNMFALYFFGTNLEYVFRQDCFFGPGGRLIYILFYLSALIVASIPDFIRHKNHYYFKSLGASGAVSAIIFSSIVIFPKSGIGLIFIPGIDIPGYLFAIIYLAVSAYLDKRGGGNINHGAHIAGAVYGILFTVVFVTVLGHVNVLDNFVAQIKASRPFLPSCNP